MKLNGTLPECVKMVLQTLKIGTTVRHIHPNKEHAADADDVKRIIAQAYDDLQLVLITLEHRLRQHCPEYMSIWEEYYQDIQEGIKTTRLRLLEHSNLPEPDMKPAEEVLLNKAAETFHIAELLFHPPRAVQHIGESDEEYAERAEHIEHLQKIFRMQLTIDEADSTTSSPQQPG